MYKKYFPILVVLFNLIGAIIMLRIGGALWYNVGLCVCVVVQSVCLYIMFKNTKA